MTMVSERQHVPRETAGFQRQLVLVHGVITMMLGFAAVTCLTAVNLYLGWIFVFGGTAGVVMLVLAHDSSAFPWRLPTAVLWLFAGVLLLWPPAQDVVPFPLVLVAFLFTEGVCQIVSSFSFRDALPEARGWMALSGMAGLFLAVAGLSGWSDSTTRSLVFLVCVSFITTGAAMATLGLAGRSLPKLAGRAAAKRVPARRRPF